MSDEQTTALTPHYASVGMTAFGGGGSLPALASMADVVSIAQLMAKSQVAVPKHLRDNPGACLAVTMQALRWEMEPFAVANKSYSVNDRMAYEAQLIAAVILTRASIAEEPDYDYEGEGGERVCIVTIKMLSGKVLTQRSPKFKDIQPKNSPLWKVDPDQQQGYYTIRAWGRRHQPHVILGVYDREEMAAESIIDVTPSASGLVDRLTRNNGEGGFDHDKVVEQTPEPKGRKKAAQAPAKAEGIDAPAAPEKAASEAPTASVEVLGDDDIPESLRKIAGGAGMVAEVVDQETGEVTETVPQPDAPTADEDSDTSASATDAPTSSVEETSETGSDDDADVITQGYPDPDEVYHLVGDEWEESGRRATYKNGKQFSSATPKSGLAIYEEHAPELAEETPEADAAPSGLPPDMVAYIDAINAATDWNGVRDALTAFYQTPLWASLDEEQKDQIRANTWNVVAKIRPAIDQATNASAFRLWITTVDDANAILGTYNILKREPVYQGLQAAQQNALDIVVDQRIKALRD